jgi:hypothetical protein
VLVLKIVGGYFNTSSYLDPDAGAEVGREQLADDAPHVPKEGWRVCKVDLRGGEEQEGGLVGKVNLPRRRGRVSKETCGGRQGGWGGKEGYFAK